eukprot:CAMPEP_0175879926 /NCGR_PEP_ID=MMETSP0107_2-20121207/42042_1 /TAXON_ID=195067 ORGANISM="Goniomonas pacifica, Strain CCMP1869" /NCGR_SAMPLE_ID=MMETSP0107_2 /ASSEMBLY_ACC=CAM_ASM_000203 /LENGTH=119 /DNA_ID=CAMNT_0017199631 /DNA_START=418 /DNA_END=778 /DNA_ORIENTATION=+
MIPPLFTAHWPVPFKNFQAGTTTALAKVRECARCTGNRDGLRFNVSEKRKPPGFSKPSGFAKTVRASEQEESHLGVTGSIGDQGEGVSFTRAGHVVMASALIEALPSWRRCGDIEDKKP